MLGPSLRLSLSTEVGADGNHNPFDATFLVIKKLGEGRCGSVYSARRTDERPDHQLPRKLAIKVFSCRDADESFHRELHILRHVRGHPHVVDVQAFQAHDPLVIVMPFYGNRDLHAMVHKQNGLSENEARKVSFELMTAVQYLHGLGVLHRDIKPENMLIKRDGRTVLIDFDIACFVSDSQAMQTSAGTPGYLAPEVASQERYTLKADMFGVGCVMYFMIAVCSPFGAVTDCPNMILQRTVRCDYSFDDHFDGISNTYKALVGELVLRCPMRRLSADIALVHACFAEDGSHAIAVTSRTLPHSAQGSESLAQSVTVAQSGPQVVSSALAHSILPQAMPVGAIGDAAEQRSHTESAAQASTPSAGTSTSLHRGYALMMAGLSRIQEVVRRSGWRRVHPVMCP
eukprot:TRINITY_DN54870_c0_g1_i1.p1 TRINITY_DN54870_c0_g1~~TRINITY_DN54870_c0_g1_i1.p1  ORF type:complete len:401 (+),score=25.27 TRINITY_DN54870_c0_g1_i1:72-1274(+)